MTKPLVAVTRVLDFNVKPRVRSDGTEDNAAIANATLSTVTAVQRFGGKVRKSGAVPTIPTCERAAT